ncbi:MAG: FAD:protein FMN transferase [Alphaproteobacteria bacterium]|nr:FAD:protein FMN transferase [Alphaproteobacteria bacterium]
MSKMSTDLERHALNGPTMGTRWSALFHAPSGFDAAPVRAALQAAVDEVDAQMSTWKPDSDLTRLNQAPTGEWVTVPGRLLDVIRLGLKIGRESGGAFDIGLGDAVTAWGFGPAGASPDGIREATRARRSPAHDVLEIDGTRIRKKGRMTLDLNGVAKGYGVDRLVEILGGFGIRDALVGIDGEMRAMGLRHDGDAGDYRHWIEVKGRRLSHTMDPVRGAPLMQSPASVTVIAPTCVEADAWATAFMVLGPDRSGEIARRSRLNALFLLRGEADSIRCCRIGGLFSGGQTSVPPDGAGRDGALDRGPAVASPF